MSASERKIAELEQEITKLRHMIGQQLRSDEDTLWTDGGVNPEGEPFCTIRWGDLGAQMSAEDMRAFALTLIQTADAAEYDAAMYREMKAMDFDEQMMAMVLTMARASRGVKRDQAGETKITTQPIKDPPIKDQK